MLVLFYVNFDKFKEFGDKEISRFVFLKQLIDCNIYILISNRKRLVRKLLEY